MGWTFRDNLIDITGYITADSNWNVTATITELPSSAKTVWLRVRQTDTTARVIGATHPDINSTAQGSAHSLKPQYFMVGVKDRTLRYYCASKTNQFWEILAHSDNDGEAITAAGAYPNYTPDGAGSYEDKTFTQLSAAHTFAALMVDMGGTAYRTAYRDNGAEYDYYHEKNNSVITTAFCPITNKVGEIKVANTAAVHLLTAGFVGVKITPADITIPGTGWRTIDASAVFPAGAAVAILEVRNESTTNGRVCALRNTGVDIPDDITSGVAVNDEADGYNTSQFRLVGLNASRQFDINVANTTDIKVRAYGYITNQITSTLSDLWRLTLGMLPFIGGVPTSSLYKKLYMEIEL